MSDGAGKRAIGEAAAGAIAARDALEPEQLAFLPTGVDPERRGGREQLALVRANQRGRPPGAQNKATREIKELCRKLFGDPMLESMRLVEHTPETLARYLGCDRLDAARLIEDVRKDLRRYFYAPMVPTDDKGNAVPFMYFDMSGQRGGASGGRPPWEYISEQNQQLSGPAGEVSDGAASDEGGK